MWSYLLELPKKLHSPGAAPPHARQKAEFGVKMQCLLVADSGSQAPYALQLYCARFGQSACFPTGSCWIEHSRAACCHHAGLQQKWTQCHHSDARVTGVLVRGLFAAEAAAQQEVLHSSPHTTSC